MEEKTEKWKPRERKRNPWTSSAMPAIVAIFMICMVVGIVVRSKAPRGSCVLDHVYRKSVCLTKKLRSIPSDVSDSVLSLQMGHDLDKAENYFSLLEQSNFSRFLHLQNLSLIKCGIEEMKPGTFSTLDQLKVLDLKYNRISRIHEGTFDGLTNLEQLHLSNNPIRVLTDFIFKGTKIVHLFMDNNPALEEISDKVFEDASIKSITLKRTSLKTIPAATFAVLSSTLANLTWENNQLPLELPEVAFKGLQLEQLSLKKSEIRNVDFLKYVDAKEIYLDGNPLRKLHIESGSSSGITRKLSLKETSLKTISCDDIAFFTSLEELDLEGNEITIVNSTTFCETLKIVDLSENDIFDFDDNFGEGFPNMEELYLHNNDIQTLPENLEGLVSRLTKLSLYGNPLHRNCELRWFAKWIEDHRSILEEVDSVVCETPEWTNFTLISDYGFQCSPPAIFNASFDADGISLVCIAGGDPAPKVTWIPPSPNEEIVSYPLRSERKTFQTKSSLLITRDGNYTCVAENVAGKDSVVVNTQDMPSSGIKFVVESKEIEILETVPGFLVTLCLLALLGYILRKDSIDSLKDKTD